MRYLPFFILIIGISALSSCERSPLDLDLSVPNAALEYGRLDVDFFEANFRDSTNTHQELYQKYGPFYKLYLEDILKTGPVDRIESFIIAEEFVRDFYMQECYAAIQNVHDPEIDRYMDQLEQSFGYFQHYYPEDSLPEIIFYHSGFNFGIYSLDDQIGIGLDWFLGKDHPITQKLPFPKYRQQKMDADYLTANVMKDWCNRKLYADIEGENLLETLVYYGKIMYLLEAITPEMADSTRMNWSSTHTEWCEREEFKIWKELASDQATLYNDNAFEVKKWITDGPFTSGLPQESPGMVGVWMGWQMLRDHHNRFPEKDLRDILQEEAATILRSYNPKK